MTKAPWNLSRPVNVIVPRLSVFYIQNHGRLRMQPEKITFKASRSGKIEQFSPDGLESVNWTRAPKGWELSLVAKSGSCTRLQGFKETVRDSLSHVCVCVRVCVCVCVYVGVRACVCICVHTRPVVNFSALWHNSYANPLSCVNFRTLIVPRRQIETQE